LDSVLLHVLPQVISILFGVSLAVFVGLKGLKRPTNLGFSIGVIGLVFQELAVLMISLSSSVDNILVLGKTMVFGGILLGGGWLLFAMTFARVDEAEIFRKNRLWLGLYFLVSLSFLGFPLFSEVLLTELKPELLKINSTASVFYVLYLVVLVFILMNLEQTFRASSGGTRYQTKYMILGSGGIVAFEIYRTGQVLLFSSISMDFTLLFALGVILCYFLLLFAIVRHRLLNVDLFVSRYVLYKSVVLLSVGAYLAVVGLAVVGVQRFGNASYVRLIPIVIFAGLLGMVILLLSEGLKLKMQNFINTHFYKNKHDYRNKWQEFTGAVGTKVSLTELLPSLVSWLAESIGTNDSAIWLFDKERDRFYLASRRGFPTAPSIWSEESALIKTVREKGASFELTVKNVLFDEIRSAAPTFFDANPVSAWIPIDSNTQMIGILALGRKITDERYDLHDLELLLTIAGQAAGQIERVRLIEELGVVRELKAIHTLSSFFLHDLKNYTSTLSLLAQNVEKHGSNPDFQKDAFVTIENTVDKMNQLIKHITVVAKGLVLVRSEMDLNDLVDATLAGLDGALGLKGRICSIFGDFPRFTADPDQLANVLRNLIINACNASKEEGNVTIETRSEGEQVYFSVSDEGCGMSEEFISTKLFKPLRTTRAAGWGIGLFQCQQIVKAHGGRIKVESEEGVGSTFTVELPLSEK